MEKIELKIDACGEPDTSRRRVIVLAVGTHTDRLKVSTVAYLMTVR